MRLRLARRVDDGVVVLTVAGELDLFTAPILRQEAKEAIKQNGAHLVFDLEGLEFMDSSGLSALIETWRQAVAAGGGLCLAAPRHAVAKLLQTTGLDRRFKIYPDAEAAVAARQA
ncbi:STAS domain-containing protein [Rhizohabitans arisaemae]|uniref:STAS domain-containing protein n=1 Tax=Rhizohabitans arisaemae TaxID=2720610 RepID=UPI0024B1A192|nr:STAS domain-containing protein [Rhizohabitans arisaemae]